MVGTVNLDGDDDDFEAEPAAQNRSSTRKVGKMVSKKRTVPSTVAVDDANATSTKTSKESGKCVRNSKSGKKISHKATQNKIDLTNDSSSGECSSNYRDKEEPMVKEEMKAANIQAKKAASVIKRQAQEEARLLKLEAKEKEKKAKLNAKEEAKAAKVNAREEAKAAKIREREQNKAKAAEPDIAAINLVAAIEAKESGGEHVEYVVQMAKSGRALCKKCDTHCANKEVRIGLIQDSDFGMFYRWQHLACTVFSKTITPENAQERLAGLDCLAPDVREQVLDRVKV
jgi:hypothetical protein